MKHTRRTVRWLFVLLVSVGTLANAAGWHMDGSIASHAQLVAENSPPGGPGLPIR